MTRHKKISELEQLTDAELQDSDLLVVVDVSEGKTKKILVGDVKSEPPVTPTWGDIEGNIADQTDLNAILVEQGADIAQNASDIGTVGSNLSAHESNTSNPHNVTKAQVGLSDVTNDAQVKRSEMGQANGVATLGADSKIPNSQLPALAITNTYVVASQAAMLALSVEVGDVAVRSDISKSFILSALPASTLGNWQELLTPPNAVLSVNGATGVVVLSTTNISEGTNQYFTNARARSAISGTSPISYNSTTGAISFDFSIANIFTNSQKVTRASLNSASGDGLSVETSTNATVSQVQSSPAMRWKGKAWQSNVSASRDIDFRAFVLPGVGLEPLGSWRMQVAQNNGAWSDIYRINEHGEIVSNVLSGGLTGFEINFAASNSAPGTTRHLRLSNTGGQTYIDFNFNGTLKGAIGINSSGDYQMYSSAGHYYFNQGVTSPSNIAEIWSGGFYHGGGGGFFGGNVVAGGAEQGLFSTLVTKKSLGMQFVKVTSNTVLTNQYTQILADTSVSTCVGTPTYTCAYYTNQTDCELRNSHGGCGWSGYPCYVYNGDPGTCNSYPGCSADTASCSAFNGDSYNCSNTSGCSYPGNLGNCSSFNGDSMSCGSHYGCYYPGNAGDCSVFTDSGTCSSYMGCSPNYGDCSVFSGDESTCNSTSGCSPSTSDCSTFSDGGFDGSACATQPSCSYDLTSGTCSGSYFSGCSGSFFENCSGSYDDGTCSGSYDDGTCSGSYYTGNCSGSTGSCGGTSNCAGVSLGNCTSESGCSVGSGVTLTMPADSNTTLLSTYFIKKAVATGTLTILPNTGQTIEGTSSLSITTNKAAVMLSFLRETADCVAFSGDESTCGATSGCTQAYGDCSSYGDEGSCTGDAHCSWNGMSCDGGSYFSYCYGTYVTAKNWNIMASHKMP